MYTLVTVADVVQIQPSDFEKPSLRAIEDFINEKYADKVIHKIGLCVGFHSLISASEGLIGHGTGIVNVNVDFKLIVFRPFKGEIIRAIISHSNATGIFMSMDFFETIAIPPEFFFDPSKWQDDGSGNKIWVWNSDENTELYFDKAEKCLIRVEQEHWKDLSPDMKGSANFESMERDSHGMRVSPYKILGSMLMSGLGPDLWWIGEDTAPDPIASRIVNGEDEDVDMA
ncbi:DNA-directed RNA polymerase III complex subunit Rpc25 [Recurvomyces mirabilis]|uniref:DNA-directed RNA polymerase subunit n=1 Tax=Recurvomyces mirabilis TaxID=574656 RepID=A0AAE0WP65_9PEZI|nr:DNA-directed RNA polymerase III complex subunit Rpc25 [Recurvomyces mirabilis]KAK5153004.1 DNA-directed RNA polymerase III complex subunit Rpc25 [Recurvomyces mirabilis]